MEGIRCMNEWYYYDVENDPIVIGAYKDLELKKKHPILAAIIFDVNSNIENPEKYIQAAKLRAYRRHERRNRKQNRKRNRNKKD